MCNVGSRRAGTSHTPARSELGGHAAVARDAACGTYTPFLGQKPPPQRCAVPGSNLGCCSGRGIQSPPRPLLGPETTRAATARHQVAGASQPTHKKLGTSSAFLRNSPRNVPLRLHPAARPHSGPPQALQLSGSQSDLPSRACRARGREAPPNPWVARVPDRNAAATISGDHCCRLGR